MAAPTTGCQPDSLAPQSDEPMTWHSIQKVDAESVASSLGEIDAQACAQYLSNSPPGQRQVMDMPRRLAVEHSLEVEPVGTDEAQLKLASR